ncbi:MAG: DUF6471 domain-containing protein [Hyphomonadaceae bacterium]|nr:DUF6471 domain-containing protein [Hyphomonadaceae bacterium]
MAAKKKQPEVDYSEVAKNVLKAELRRRGVTYADLAAKLGNGENDKNLNNKIARGGFSAAFLMQCLDVIGAKAIQIAD